MLLDMHDSLLSSERTSTAVAELANRTT